MAPHVSAQGVQHRPVLLGRAELTVAQQFGQVVEVAVVQPEAAVIAVRRRSASLFDEVARYGALVHGISANAAAQQDTVAQMLAAAGVQVMAITAITPSLEDVFIASARREG